MDGGSRVSRVTLRRPVGTIPRRSTGADLCVPKPFRPTVDGLREGRDCGRAMARESVGMAFVLGAVLVVWGLVRVGLISVARRQGVVDRRRAVGAVLISATRLLTRGTLL